MKKRIFIFHYFHYKMLSTKNSEKKIIKILSSQIEKLKNTFVTKSVTAGFFSGK